MSQSELLLTTLLGGVASGVMLVVGLVIWRSALSLSVRAATLAFAISAAAWIVTESMALCQALGPGHLILMPIAYPVGGLFWLFILTVFDDRPITPLALTPAALLLISGPVMLASKPPVFDVIWYARNGAGALLALHAGLVVVRGWRDDLVEGRRRFRALLFALACGYTVVLVAAGFINKADPDGPWLIIAAGRAGGDLILILLGVSMALLALQARPSTFGASRRVEAGPDPRAETADRLMAGKLHDLMAGGAWRREGLTIGGLAGELGEPEHRLRRLINQRLEHRNFADFVNGYRIEAAKARLGAPEEARTTVATIAFDLGYGSLGPFNRAFRAATGLTPTEWRRQALQSSPELQQAV